MRSITNIYSLTGMVTVYTVQSWVRKGNLPMRPKKKDKLYTVLSVLYRQFIRDLV